MHIITLIGSACIGSILGGIAGFLVGMSMDEPGTDLPGVMCMFTVPTGVAIGGIGATIITASVIS